MKIRRYWNENAKRFCVRAIGDKILTSKGIRYLLFFDNDEKSFDEQSVQFCPFNFKFFWTRNGFHLIGFGLHSAQEKLTWYSYLKTMFSQSDYTFLDGRVKNSWAWLRPDSLEELDFIGEQIINAKEKVLDYTTSDYYRDKKVFESLGY